MKGYFSEETLKQFSQLAGESFGTDFSESGTYDFTRCVRPDGSAYGTNGKCRKGTEGEKKVEAPKVSPNKPSKEVKSKSEGNLESQYASKAKKAQEAMAKGDMDTALKLNREAMDIMSKITSKKEEKSPETQKRETKIKGVVDSLKKGGSSNLSSDSKGAYITDKVGKNEVKTLITPKTDGSYEIGYKVNNTYAKGEVTDRREQIRVALTAKRQFDTALKSLPDGTRVRAFAFDDDGSGDARRAAYEKLGFKHQGNNVLTGVVRNGKVEMMDFAESENENTKLWYLILFGPPTKKSSSQTGTRSDPKSQKAG
jgi:hypothetical protein